MRGEAFLTPEQESLIEQTFTGTRLQGEEDLLRFADELAGGRGLRLTDTPIGGEVLRQRRRLGESLASAEAGAKLDFGSRQQLFEENLRQFQHNLRLAGVQNRLNLTGSLASPTEAIEPLWRGRLAQTTTTVSPGLGQQIASGVNLAGDVLSLGANLAGGIHGFQTGGLGGFATGARV